MALPEKVLAIIRDAAEKHPDDITRATEEALRKLRPLPEYGEMAAELVRLQVRAQVCDYRHQANTELRRANGDYGGPAKVRPWESRALRRVERSWLLYFIAGKSLGELLGEELGPVAEAERARADGHLFNARLCDRLRPLVPDGKRVRECLDEKKLARIAHECNGAGGAAV